MTRCNPSRNTLRSALIVVLLIAASCGQQDSGSAPQRKASSKETIGRSNAPTDADSSAVRVVKEFFRNWKLKRYAAMHEQTVHSRDKEVFCRALKGTPIRWKNLVIEKENRVDADWWVSLSLDVTDLKSAAAAALITAKAPMSLISGTANYVLPAEILGIERWMTVRQKWHIVSVGDKHLIDIGAGDSKIDRKDNILNYFLDAAHFNFPLIPSMPENDQRALLVSAWLAGVAMDLGIETEEIKKILVEAKPLVEKGDRNPKDLIKKFQEASASRDASVLPVRSAAQEGTSLAYQACALYKAYLLMVRNTASLAEKAESMSEGNRRELAQKLQAMTFASAADRQRQHFVAARDSIVEILTSPPSDKFGKGYKEAESLQLLMPVLTDARLTGAVASECGYPEISKQVDATLKFAKAIFYTAKGFSEKKMIKARPAVRLFIEYFAVYDSLSSGKDKQSALGGIALLGLEVENISDVEDAKDFKDLREALRLLYDNPGSEVDRMRPIAFFSRIVSKAKITDTDLTNAGAGNLVTLAQKMRELFEK